MINLLEKNNFSPTDLAYSDLETGMRENIGIISLKKSKQDIKLHRQSGNRIDDNLIKELKDSLHQFENNGDIRAVILTSSHKVAFSRGAAIEEVLNADIRSCRQFLQEAQFLVLALQSFSKPLIGAINGLTLGGGLEMALCCDYRIASTRDNVVFGFPESTLGLIPAMGGTQNLRRVVDTDTARGIIKQGRVDINSTMALDMGLVNELASPIELLQKAFQTAKNIPLQKSFILPESPPLQDDTHILQQVHDFLKSIDLHQYTNGPSAPLAAALTDFIFDNTSDENYYKGLKFEFESFSFLQQTEDCHEGIQAMIDERPPRFTGR